MEQIRQKFWPDDPVWDKNYAGFRAIPKTMPLIMRIIDSQCDGQPAGRVYFTLWCRTWDSPVVSIDDPRMLAYESGFDGERAESTWKRRMRTLETLGFIKSHAGVKGDFQYVLLLNPHRVIKENKSTMTISNSLMMAFDERMLDIGAKDFDEEEKEVPNTLQQTIDQLFPPQSTTSSQ
jgi:hypothetical protein